MELQTFLEGIAYTLGGAYVATNCVLTAFCLPKVYKALFDETYRQQRIQERVLAEEEQMMSRDTQTLDYQI